MKKTLSLFVFILGLGLLLYMAGGLSMFINFPSITIIFLLVSSMLIVSDNMEDFLRGFKIMNSNCEFTNKELKSSVNALDFCIRMLSLSGVLCGIISIISLLGALNDTARIGEYASLLLLSLLYVSFIIILLLPIKYKLKKEIIYREKD